MACWNCICSKNFCKNIIIPSIEMRSWVGCFLTKDMQTPPPLRSGHINIRDEQCAKNKDGRKISDHIISRLGAMGVQKGRFGRPKIQLSSKVTKFAG